MADPKASSDQRGALLPKGFGVLLRAKKNMIVIITKNGERI